MAFKPPRVHNRLLWKLFGVNLPVIAIVIVAVWVAIDYLAADYFMTLMKEYNISPTIAHRMFTDAAHRYLLWASLLAMVCAMIFSFFLTRKVLRPLSDMTTMSQKLANGEYHHRAHIASRDEVGQLGEAFNYMAESLQRIERLRSAMVSDVAHELRTPLTNVQGYLEALRDGVIEPKVETFELLHSETLRLVKLTEGVLQLTRADAALGALQCVRLTVSNTGEGISPHDLPFIFERFYRSEKSRSRNHGGAGIGLAVVKGVIDAHGGHVGATSSAGLTQIWFTLPA